MQDFALAWRELIHQFKCELRLVISLRRAYLRFLLAGLCHDSMLCNTSCVNPSNTCSASFIDPESSHRSQKPDDGDLLVRQFIAMFPSAEYRLLREVFCAMNITLCQPQGKAVHVGQMLGQELLLIHRPALFPGISGRWSVQRPQRASLAITDGFA